MRDQAETLRQMKNNGLGQPVAPTRVISVTSGKGGVGKSNLALNTTIALSRLGLRAGILDADLGLANIDILLGMVPQYNLSHVIYGYRRISDVILQGPDDIKVIAGTSGVDDLANLTPWRLQRFTKALEELDRQLDVLLIDTGAGINHNVLSFLLASDEIMVVITNEPTSITDAYGLIKVLANKNVTPKISLIVNMVRNAREGREVADKLRFVVSRFLKRDIDYLGCVPHDEAVIRAIQQQKPLLEVAPRSQAARAINNLALALADEQGAPRTGVGNLFQRMFKLFAKS
ncbi:MAG: MinD/ParA family protein [Limnochordia bacterium]|jgi:flagellar biosynthesis protein FlhG